MFRLSTRLTRKSLVAAASVAVVATTITESQPERKKLSIYTQPDPEVVHNEAPTELEKQVGAVRRTLTTAYHDAHSQVQGVVSKWIGVEHTVEHRVKSLIAPDETLTPGILYVGIATLTGSIFARNRTILTRVFLPPALFLFSMNYFLPKTSQNTVEYLGSLEDRYFPTLAQKHAVANAHSRMAWENVKDAARAFREKVDSGVEASVKQAEEFTGLKLTQTLGWTKHLSEAVEAKVEEKAVEAKEAVKQKMQKAKDVVDEKVQR